MIASLEDFCKMSYAEFVEYTLESSVDENLIELGFLMPLEGGVNPWTGNRLTEEELKMYSEFNSKIEAEMKKAAAKILDKLNKGKK